MSKKGKTFKDTKEAKEEALFLKSRKDPHPEEKGGMRNFLREAEEERKEVESPWTQEELEEVLQEMEKDA